MINQQNRYFYNLATFLFSFAFSKWFYDSYLRIYSHYISNYGFEFALVLNAIITLILSYFVFVFLRFCYTRQIQNTTIIICYFIYILSLIYVILLKNIGDQGLVLNPLSFINDINQGSRFVPIMNLLMFIPLGFLFPLTKTNWSLSLLGLLLLESCQYVFHLGVLDLGDVTLNLLSLMIGNSFHRPYLHWLQTHLASKANLDKA